MKSQYQRLRFILGDQLNAGHSWFKQPDPYTLYVIAELHQEMHYVRHHIQKVQAFFASMQSFANGLSAAGFEVLHLTLDDTANYPNLDELIADLIEGYSIEQFHYQQPDEYRLDKQLNALCQQLNIDSKCYESEHFIVPFSQIGKHLSTSKSTRMETFYRALRKEHNILMSNGKPEGEKWNFDQQNRNKLSKADIPDVPLPKLFENSVTDINKRLARHNIQTIGEGSDTLLWPINRAQSMTLLQHFCQQCLPRFGKFQDAMTQQANDFLGDKQWSLYHSRLSFSLNSKMLHPMQVIQAAVDHYRQNENIDIAQVEGFVRQILGWREFVRAIYWLHMPKYQQHNHLSANRPLPSWFWNGKTKMNCLHHAITQSLQYGYAHHIQRLMVTGNFCLITGIHPDEVDSWYLGIYVDAIEWVEMPNTRGMSQYADGGIVGSKAYAASGNYINKMSDYCSTCHYQVKEKHTAKACPLNSLYWHFMLKHREQFEKNPRIGMVYRNWDKQDEANQQATQAKAEELLIDIENI